MSNIGQLPGYYYDEDRKKYFKILANHVAPHGAKYAKSNVKREQRETKKRKLDDKKLKKRLQQTVRRSAVLQNAVAAGTCLYRELGAHHKSRDLRGARESAAFHNLEPHRGAIITRRGDEYPIMRTLLDLLPLRADHCVWAEGNAMEAGSVIYWSGLRPDLTVLGRVDAAAFSSKVVGMHAVTGNDASALDSSMTPVVVVAEQPTSDGNVFLGTEPDYFGRAATAMRMRVGRRASYSIHASAICGTNLALGGEYEVHVLDLNQFSSLAKVDIAPDVSESNNITWLDPSVVAFVRLTEDEDSVSLWDIRSRSRGTSNRFQRSKPVTGVEAAGIRGVQLLISDNMSLDLVDTRYAKTPLLSFPHVHEGPQLQFAVNEVGTIAALDRDNDIQLYSLSSSRTMGAARRPGNSRLRNVRWFDDGSGPVLQACDGSGVVRWRWPGDEEAEYRDHLKAPSTVLREGYSQGRYNDDDDHWSSEEA